MPYDLTREQWTQLLAMLSLDAVLPLYSDMEIPVRDKGVFQETLRAVILEARRLYEMEPRRVPAVSEMLLDRLGGPAAASFAAWARGVFLGYHADQPEWSVWDIIFSQWAYSRSHDLDGLVKEKRDSFVARYCNEVDSADIRQKSEDILKNPLTDWDLEMFARQGYGSSWESGPFSIAEAIIRIQRLKKFAREWWRGLSPSERESLEARATTLVNELRVWMPGPLPHLSELLGAV